MTIVIRAYRASNALFCLPSVHETCIIGSWTALRDVKVEVVDARTVRFEHPDLKIIVQSPLVERVLELATVQAREGTVLSPAFADPSPEGLTRQTGA